MNLELAIEDIKKTKSIPYAESIIASKSNIRIDVLFKSIELAKEFCAAWAMAIRERTDQPFVFYLKYMLSTGQDQQLVLSYIPHAARRGCDFNSEGSQRTSKLKRRLKFIDKFSVDFMNDDYD